MSSLYEDRPVQSSLDGLWAGTIATTITDAEDMVEVLLKGFSEEHRFGPCRWVFNGSKFPERGNECLVMFDDQQRPFVVWWMPTFPDWVSGEGISVYQQTATPVEPTNTGDLWIDTDETPPQWGPTIPLVTALPSSPFDGQEIYYQSSAMATDGIVWHFRYRAASVSANKWELIGGLPLAAQVMTEEQHNTSGSYINLATVGPIITAPLTGSYRFHIETDGLAPPSGAVTLSIAPSINDAAGPAQTEVIIVVPAANWRTHLQNNGDISLTAEQTVRIKYYTDGNGAYFRYRRIELIPVRV